MTIEITSIETYEMQWDQWPAGVRRLTYLAETMGWSVRVGFSRGDLEPGKTRDTIGVWLNGYGHRAAAFWERDPESDTVSGYAWKATTTAIWQGGRRPGAPCFPYANHSDFKEWVEARGAMAPDFRNRHAVRALPLQDVPLAPIQGCELPPAMRTVKVSRKSEEAS